MRERHRGDGFTQVLPLDEVKTYSCFVFYYMVEISITRVRIAINGSRASKIVRPLDVPGPRLIYTPGTRVYNESDYNTRMESYSISWRLSCPPR